MNENGLDFRHIIKAFVPGIISLACFISILDLIGYLLTEGKIPFFVTEYVTKYKTISVSVILPSALFTGIMLNTICFVAFQNRFIRKIVVGNNNALSSLEKLKENVRKLLTTYYYDHLNLSKHNIDNDEFYEQFDYESFLLHRQSISSLLHLQRCYWYYLEFQLNSILTMFIILFTLGLNLIFREDIGITNIQSVVIFLGSLLLCFFISWLFLKAIRLNYITDMKNNISYYLGAFHICKAKKQEEKTNE
jgi:hypothetical protein